MIKRFANIAVEWLPILLSWALLWCEPDLYIKELSVHIPQECFYPVILGIFWLCLMRAAFDMEEKPLIWRAILNIAPLEAFCLIFFFQYHFVLAVVIVGVFIILDLSIACWAYRKMHAEMPADQARYRWKAITGRFTALLAVLLFTVPCALCVFVYGLHQPYLVSSIEKEVYEESSFEELAGRNKEVLQNLNETTWNTLTDEEKINTLQIVVNIEASYLTMHPITIQMTKLRDDTIGEYSHTDKTIYIDMEHAADAEAMDVLESVCHECRHAYQHSIVEMLDWSDEEVQSHYFYKTARKWKTEFENYQDGHEDFYAYYQQSVEADARYYAESSRNEYMNYLEDAR